jgi:hypothetical protein
VSKYRAAVCCCSSVLYTAVCARCHRLSPAQLQLPLSSLDAQQLKAMLRSQENTAQMAHCILLQESADQACGACTTILQ